MSRLKAKFDLKILKKIVCLSCLCFLLLGNAWLKGMASVFASLDLRRLAIGESQGVDGASMARKLYS